MPHTAQSEASLAELYRRPGFLIRRAQQIAVSLFLEETGELGITNSQFGILFIIRHRPEIDQIGLAKALGLDRSTTGMVVGKLEKDGLIKRSRGTVDKRKHRLTLTRAGEKMLERLAEPARRAQSRLLSAFSANERGTFVALLEKFIAHFNDTTRVPIAPRSMKAKRGKAAAQGTSS